MEKLTGLGRQKPLRMIVYQPVYAGEKFVGCAITKFPYYRAEIGDVFTTEKRPADYLKMLKQKEYKIEAIRMDAIGGACVVILERKQRPVVEMPIGGPQADSKKEPIVQPDQKARAARLAQRLTKKGEPDKRFKTASSAATDSEKQSDNP